MASNKPDRVGLELSEASGALRAVPAPTLRSPTRVVAAPAGVSTRTRLRVPAAELAMLTAMGEHTTAPRNADLRLAKVGPRGRRARC